MSCNGCDPIGVGLVKDKSYQVSFLPSGTPSDAEYAGNENVKYAESNDIIIMQDTGNMYQYMKNDGKLEWVLKYEPSAADMTGYCIDACGYLFKPETIGELPDDLVLNGNIYTAPDAYLNGTKQLPTGLSLNSNIVMTDGSVYFPTTNNNNGVLCAA